MGLKATSCSLEERETINTTTQIKHYYWRSHLLHVASSPSASSFCPRSTIPPLRVSLFIRVGAAFLDNSSFSVWKAVSGRGSSKSSWLPKLNWEEEEDQWERSKTPTCCHTSGRTTSRHLYTAEAPWFLSLILPVVGWQVGLWAWQPSPVHPSQTPPLPRLPRGWWV